MKKIVNKIFDLFTANNNELLYCIIFLLILIFAYKLVIYVMAILYLFLAIILLFVAIFELFKTSFKTCFEFFRQTFIWGYEHYKIIFNIIRDVWLYFSRSFPLLLITMFLSLYLVGLLDMDFVLSLFLVILLSIVIHSVLSLISNYILIKKIEEEKSIIIIEGILKVLTSVVFTVVIGITPLISKSLYLTNDDFSISDINDSLNILIYLFFSVIMCHFIMFESAKKLIQKNKR